MLGTVGSIQFSKSTALLSYLSQQRRQNFKVISANKEQTTRHGLKVFLGNEVCTKKMLWHQVTA